MGLSVEAQSVLRRVRARVPEEWCRGHYKTWAPGKGDQFCLVGLVRNETDYVGVGFTSAYSEVISALRRNITCEFPQAYCIEEWNDKIGRKKKDVVALIDRTLKGGE